MRLSNVLHTRSLAGVILAAALFTPATDASAQDLCDAVLAGGNFDYATTTSSSEAAQLKRQAFCDKGFVDAGTMKQNLSDFGLTFDILGLDLTQGDQLNQWETRWHEVCSDTESWSSEALDYFSESRTASAVVTDAWSKCMARQGFHQSSVVAGDGRSFSLEFRYVTEGDNSFVFEYQIPGGGAVCTPGPGAPIEAHGSFSVACKRDKATQDTLFSINSRNAGAKTYVVPGRPVAPRPPSRFTVQTRTHCGPHSGTGDHIWLKVYRAQGAPIEVHLNNPHVDDFELCAIDTFEVPGDLSSGIRSATLSIRDSKGNGYDDWRTLGFSIFYGDARSPILSCDLDQWLGDGERSVQTLTCPSSQP